MSLRTTPPFTRPAPSFLSLVPIPYMAWTKYQQPVNNQRDEMKQLMPHGRLPGCYAPVGGHRASRFGWGPRG